MSELIVGMPIMGQRIKNVLSNIELQSDNVQDVDQEG
jgi:hypothetical protein